MKHALWVLAMVTMGLSLACSPRRAGQGTSAQTETAPPIVLGQFSSMNGEGYSGPDFVFNLVPDPGHDNRIAIAAVQQAYNVCMFEGSLAQDHKKGLLPGVLRLLGQIYGANPSVELRARAEQLFQDESYMAAPYPRIRWSSGPTGVRYLNDVGDFLIGDFKNIFSIGLILPGGSRSVDLQTRVSLPYFFATVGRTRFTPEGERLKTWMRGNAVFYPGERRGPAEPLYINGKGQVPYVLNTQDLYECMLGQSQLMIAEEASQQDLTDDVAVVEYRDWFVSRFAGGYQAPRGQMRIEKSGAVEVTVDSDDLRAKACPTRLRGQIVSVYDPLAVDELDHLSAGPQRAPGVQFFLKIALNEAYHQGRFTMVSNMACLHDLPPLLAVNAYSLGQRSSEGEIKSREITMFWPIVQVDAAGFQVGNSAGKRLAWQKVDGPVADFQFPEKTAASLQDAGGSARCELLQPWLENRWNKSLPHATTIGERKSLYLSEYDLRRAVAKRIFESYFRTGSLDPLIFEDCLKGNGERQNFLHTLSMVFWEETVERLQELQERSGSTALAAFLREYKNGQEFRAPPLFRMTGHAASRPDNQRVGGVLQGAPALFLNAFSLSPEAWLMIWVHEVSHYLDQRLTDAILESQTLADRLASSPSEELKRKLGTQWVRNGLERTLWAENRAWLLTFQIYGQVRDQLPARIAWLETALSSQRSEESLEDFTLRLLKELNGKNETLPALFSSSSEKAMLEEFLRQEIKAGPPRP